MHALDSSRLPFNHHKLRQMALAASVSLRLELIIEADYPPRKVQEKEGWEGDLEALWRRVVVGCASCGSFMSILLTRNVCIMFASPPLFLSLSLSYCVCVCIFITTTRAIINILCTPPTETRHDTHTHNGVDTSEGRRLLHCQRGWRRTTQGRGGVKYGK